MRTSILAGALAMGLWVPAFAAPPPTVAKAQDGIFAAFSSHPLVALGEWHGLSQEQDFYAALIRDPRFAAQVGNIVLETGDAAQQGVVDRYVNGETVPYVELRKVWADTVGWFPAVTRIGAINVYATIRAINMALPPENRIKVWLGDPPIDWTKIKAKADWDTLETQREIYPAHLIETEILAKGKKALVIYGVGHFGLYPGYQNVRTLIGNNYPDALFVVAPYVGYSTKACAAPFERHIKDWPVPSLAWPIRGSLLEADIYRPHCFYFEPGSGTDAQHEIANRNNQGLTSDALLYLGPPQQLLLSPDNPDGYLDLDYRAELDRRSQIRTGKPAVSPDPAENTAVPRPFCKAIGKCPYY